MKYKIIIVFLFLFLPVYFLLAPEKTLVKNIKEKKIAQKIEKPKIVKLAMIGDVLIHSRVYKDAKVKKNGYDFKPMLAEIKNDFQSYDLVFANQESIIGGKKIGLSTYPRFNSPEEIGEALVDAGVNIISTANNHSLDKGFSGIQNSLSF
jgi:poly-gamma-glutamate synthesis protein (capsule biosynthesis protein)